MEGGKTLLAQEMNKLIQRRGWDSYQAAANATGASPATIRRMHIGQTVKPQTVMEFARKIGANEEYWGKLAIGIDPNGDSEGVAQEIVYSRDPEDIRFYSNYDNLEVEDKELLRQMAEKLARSERKKSIGGRGK